MDSPGDASVPLDFLLDAYDFPLDPQRIAQAPPAARHDSRLLTLGKEDGAVSLGAFPDLLGDLGAGDCLVRNVARVDRARLRGTKAATGGKVEALLVGVLSPASRVAMFRPSKKTRPGTRVRFGTVEAEIGEVLEGGHRAVHFASAQDVEAAIASAGELPLPPYVTPADQDPARYQTTYARAPGSVAAPTAGFHFEATDFAAFEAAGGIVVDVVLDVGAGTFAPVRCEDIRQHSMHSEAYRIEAGQAVRFTRALDEKRRIVALGTTAMRVLESLPEDPGEWRDGFAGTTNLFAYPGYRFRRVQALVTNFHLPQSTLLMLVAAFAGREAILEAYAQAQAAGFRFYSFGDCCWIR